MREERPQHPGQRPFYWFGEVAGEVSLVLVTQQHLWMQAHCNLKVSGLVRAIVVARRIGAQAAGVMEAVIAQELVDYVLLYSERGPGRVVSGLTIFSKIAYLSPHG